MLARRAFVSIGLLGACVALTGCYPIAPPPPRDPRLFIVGDSVSLGAQPAIRRRMTPLGWWVKQISVESLHTYQAAGIVQANRSWIGDVVIVQLGTNDGGDPQFAAWIDQLMTQLQGVPRVYWINLRNFRGFVPTANAMIDAAAARWPNVRVLDWGSYSNPRPWIVYGDGYHLNPVGQVRMAQLIESALAGFIREQRAAALVTTSTTAPVTTTTATSMTRPTTSKAETDESSILTVALAGVGGLVVGGAQLNLAARAYVRRTDGWE